VRNGTPRRFEIPDHFAVVNASRNHQRRHLWLLISLLVIFIVSPLVAPYYYGPTILTIIAMAVLLSATYAVSHRRVFLVIGLAVSTLSIILNFWVKAAPNHCLIVISQGTLAVLIGFFAVVILGYVLGAGKVTADKIYGAICVYLLLGYAFAFVYSVMEEISPGSFTTISAAALDDYVTRVMQMRYFSFVTLATVGYGDIVPHTQIAQTIALLEAMLGQFYLVALIGRLVGLHIVHAERSEPK
jgi:hypothetical protein